MSLSQGIKTFASLKKEMEEGWVKPEKKSKKM